ncbi:macro domain-containing protein [Clostridium sp. DL1XJH146]
MPIQIIRNDITKMEVDVIVNAANTRLKMGGGVCGAIFHAAGVKELQEECDSIRYCKVGQAVITSGYNLSSKYVIHTVGPIWKDGNSGEADKLYNCYINSLKLALQYKCDSMTFPLISSGIYGYPKDQALHIAVTAISEFLLNHDIMVYLVVYDKKASILSEKLFSKIEKYIDENYVKEEKSNKRRRYEDLREFLPMQQMESKRMECDECSSAEIKKSNRKLEDLVNQLDESFTNMLLRLIDDKSMTDAETYKRANISRKLFSKIKNNENYKPSKLTAIAFAISLKLNLDETFDLLSKAGYTLSHSSKFDVIIEYFIIQGNYNIYEINEALFDYDQSLLGA